jgi:hypothetical protein
MAGCESSPWDSPPSHLHGQKSKFFLDYDRNWTVSIYFDKINKLKLSHYTTRRRLGERYSSYSFSTSALDGGEWSTSRPGRALYPGKGPPVPIVRVQEAGWVPEPVWTHRIEEKSFHLYRRSNIDRPIVQPVARYNTD